MFGYLIPSFRDYFCIIFMERRSLLAQWKNHIKKSDTYDAMEPFSNDKWFIISETYECHLCFETYFFDDGFNTFI